ncbi:MAG: hypothetical protein K2X35_25900 [Bryobacteraceae bacterium]|nr:hypothetical protein [Bryobacteraceae bacterium]
MNKVINGVPTANVNYASNIAYAPHGLLGSINSRLQTESHPPSGSVQESYTYDALNRLKTYTRPGAGSQTYSYDRFGNRAVLAGGLIQVTALTPQVADELASSVEVLFPNNRWTALTYDAAGNVLIDPAGTGRSYTYDAENRVKTATMPNTPAITYSYDGEGRRVRKEVGGQATTVFVYDAFGQLAAEYGPADGIGVRYLTVDHLGSTRMVTDQSGAVMKRMDYLPFGEEYPAVGYPISAERTGVKFTGKERDAETGLDYFGARYMSAAQGRFASPDEFTKDSNVADPQSWNKFAYARNNPLRYVDPTGERAEVSTTCTTNQQNQTTCQVNVSASIAVYAAAGSNLTQQQMNAAASTIQNSIQGAWTGQFQQDGVTYNVTTTVNVQVATTEAAAMQSGAQNVIGLSSANATATADSFVRPRALLGGPDTGVWNINNLGSGVAAHEFAHLLGVNDKFGMVLSNTNLLNNSAIPRQAMAADFGWGVREAVSGVNSWAHGPAFRSMRYGEVFPKLQVYRSRTTVGTPFLWWK